MMENLETQENDMKVCFSRKRMAYAQLHGIHSYMHKTMIHFLDIWIA